MLANAASFQKLPGNAIVTALSLHMTRVVEVHGTSGTLPP